MKKKIQVLLAVFAAGTLCFTACKKNSNEVDYAAELSAHSDDQSRFSNETDEIANDANNAIDGYTAFNGRIDNSANTAILPCNVTAVVDSVSSPKKITLTYNGLNCAGTRTRVGTVVLTLPANVRWKDAGAVLTVQYQNLKITRVSDGKSVTINGTKTITNVNGGLIRNLATSSPITHRIASTGMTITFDDGSQRTWQIAKQRVFTYSNGIVITTTGTGTVDGATNVSEWGTNRYGNPFVTSITQALVVRQDCNFRLTTGVVTHTRLAATAVVTFGLDASGNATSCPGTGPYYFKLVWTGINGIVRTVILPYY
jgi:hypothetical protein